MSIGNKESVKILKWRLFHRYLQFRMFCIRRKKKIRFCFLLQELTQWKTELLYQAMLKHPRFEPIIAISPCIGYPGAEKELMKYCDSKGYQYVWLDPEKTIVEQLRVDMATYQKPYLSETHPAHRVDSNRRIPFVVMPYALAVLTEEWVVNQRITYLCWRQFINNESCKEDWSKIHRLKGMNYAVTGLPVMDEMLTPKEKLEDVWPNKDGRKRIIYAPHHTIADMHWEGIAYSTFLENCEFMLEMRDKYADRVFFVFKPHPSLWNQLLKYWGKEKAEAYYARWEKEGESHIETGKYLSLFKYSDAMIHDCGSFTIEYMYMDKPVMYLLRDEHHADNMIPYAREAFDLHYKGRTHEDIENFIIDVINDVDPLKEQRAAYKEKNLLPPNGKTACENIMDSILGK